MKKLILGLAAALLFTGFLPTGPVLAQNKTPSLPPPLQALVEEGSQVQYLGQHNGLDGWVTIKNGQEQYFYVTDDGESILMGLLFDRDGKLITVRQVKELQDKSGNVLDMFASENPDHSASETGQSMKAFKTPAEQLYSDISESNWIRLGREDAPVIYTFVDPQCPHCKAFTRDLENAYIKNGLLQVRIIPIGLRPETRSQAAFLLAAPNPEERWFRHVGGDEKALPLSSGLNEQGIERNLSIMQSWQLDVTPLTIYKAKNGEVKIVQGRPKNPDQILQDLTPQSSQSPQ